MHPLLHHDKLACVHSNCARFYRHLPRCGVHWNGMVTAPTYSNERRDGLSSMQTCRAEPASELQALLSEMGRQLQSMQGYQGQPESANNTPESVLTVKGVWYQPAGCESPLLRDIDMTIPPNSLGLVYGRSGSGKTTLLQMLAGLREPTNGSVAILNPDGSEELLDSAKRQAACGLVFQFPERHFLGANILTELILGTPSAASPQGYAERMRLQARLPAALAAVKIEHFPMTTDPNTLSDGYKRRLALAVQLIRRPTVLLLDEPLAGLDWKARADLVKLLQALKQDCSLLVISHDLRELAPIVDVAWEMLPGGILEQREGQLPIPKLDMGV